MSSQGSGKLTIGAVMMVKNEEKNLPRCLNSIKNFVDEIVIVDTGSTDKSIEIAKSFGAKVYNHPWEDDFSAHRNQGLEHCSCDWAFIIDADERFFLANSYSKQKMVDWLEKGVKARNVVAVAIKVEDIQRGKCVMEFNSTRFFKRGEVHYQGIVHNAPQLHNRNGAMFIPFLKLQHYGYDLLVEDKKKKFERTSGLLFKQLEQEPKNWLIYFYLCQIYTDSSKDGFSEGMLQKGTEYGEIYLKHKEELRPNNNFNTSIYFTLIHSYMSMKNRERTRQLLEEGMEELPEDLDLFLALCEFGVLTKNIEFIVTGGKKYLEVYEKFQKDPGAKKNRFIYSCNIEMLSTVLYYMSGTLVTEGAKYIDILINKVLPLGDKAVQKKITTNLMTILTNPLVPPPVEGSVVYNRNNVKAIKPLTTI